MIAKLGRNFSAFRLQLATRVLALLGARLETLPESPGNPTWHDPSARNDTPELRALHLRGLTCAEAKDLTGAAAAFNEAYRVDSAAARTLGLLAYVRLLRKDSEVAFRLATDALLIDPDEAVSHYVRGAVYAARKERPAAVLSYRRALHGWSMVPTTHPDSYTEAMSAYIERWQEPAPPGE